MNTAVKRQQHPSGSNSHAYSHDFCLFVQFLKQNCWNRHSIIRQAQDIYLFPSPRTIRQHNRRLLRLGHLRKFENQGNNLTTVLRGTDIYVLSFWRTVWPKSTHAELNAILFNTQLARGETHLRFFLLPHRSVRQKTVWDCQGRVDQLPRIKHYFHAI